VAGRVLITGGTGYLGARLIPRLRDRGWSVCAVVRPGSESKLPAGCTLVQGDVLSARTYRDSIQAGDTFVQLVGVSHPSPAKAAQFRSIDYVSAVEAIAAAKERGAGHFVYVSVAHPAPVMKAYWSVRAECEEILRESGMSATVLRPWYVLGPGHRWPLLLKPFYFVGERIPAARESAKRLGLVTIEQMTRALERAVTEPAQSWRVWGVEQIRAC
jgi:uncharacterized protein YbjT (DUF2867 family)